jgi:sugar/nucleoside kinase (ribokinase family)
MLSGVQVANIPSSLSTTFENRYQEGRRVQRLLAVAPPLSPAHLPEGWSRCTIALLGPVAQEVDPAFARAFPEALLAISPQGWMRNWDGTGLVTQVPWEGEGVIEGVKALFLSEEDLPQGEIPRGWLRRIPIIFITQGERGALLRWEGRWFHIPPYPAREVDPTGAGDVFAAAFLVRYRETGDPFASALFASCAASLSVEAPGLEGVPTRARVEERFRQFPERRVRPL